MAATQQQKGIQYEDLVLKSELKDQPEATLLTIDLPGFTKEQIKVTYVNSSKIIRVTGERPVADRRWSRFNEVFTVPHNCLVDNIHGSFRNNVLTITMPKENITKTTNLPESSKTLADPMEKRLLEESRRKEEEEDEKNQKKKKLLEEKEELIRKLQEEALVKEKAEMMKLQEETMAEARKLQEEVKAKEKASKRKFVEEATLEKASKRKLVEEATLEKNSDKKFMNDAGGEEKKLPEAIRTKSGPLSGPKSGSGGVREVVKTAEEKLGDLVEKEKKMVKGIMEKIRRKEITSEEKKLMVNVGVAALVIFGLGAYVSYTFCCSSSSSSSSSTKPE